MSVRENSYKSKIEIRFAMWDMGRINLHSLTLIGKLIPLLKTRVTWFSKEQPSTKACLLLMWSLKIIF